MEYKRVFFVCEICGVQRFSALVNKEFKKSKIKFGKCDECKKKPKLILCRGR